MAGEELSLMPFVGDDMNALFDSHSSEVQGDFFPFLLGASSVMVSLLSTTRGRIEVPAIALLLLACCISCTNQQETGEQIRPGSTSERSVPEQAVTAMDTTSIPVADRSHFPVLADAYRRVDPKADGWGTEAFSEQAAAKLKYLKAYLKSGQTDDLNSLIAPSAQSTAFFPSEFAPLHSPGT